MPDDIIFEALIECGRRSDFLTVATIIGAGTHTQVSRFSDSLRRHGLHKVRALPVFDRIAFVKALAVYEHTVGGLGSVTALERVLPLIPDEDHCVLDWILSTTLSYGYYGMDASSYAELVAIRSSIERRRKENEAREAERARHAKDRKAQQASERLFGAVRRGDLKALEALLNKGANPGALTPEGVTVMQYAKETGRSQAAEMLVRWQSGAVR